jgi:hypothetical protein
MKKTSQFAPEFEGVFQAECGKCQIMHTTYGHYIIRHSDLPGNNWTVPNVETAYALCHRLSKGSKHMQSTT